MTDWRWVEIAPGIGMVAFDDDPVLHHPAENHLLGNGEMLFDVYVRVICGTDGVQSTDISSPESKRR